jgi:parallel beta-helix repeat protein
MHYVTPQDRNKRSLSGLRIALVLLFATALALGAAPNQQLPSALAATTVVVSPESLNGWAFDGDGTTGGAGSFVAGPATSPLGSGSARLVLDGTTTSRELLRTFAFAGTRFDQITNLEYSSYRSSADAGNNLALALQFDTDYNLTDGITAWQGRLVYEPYQANGAGGTVVQNTWQTWNPLDANARWWASGAPGNSLCPQAAPCTWAQVLINWPNAGLRASIGGLQFKAGGPAPSFDGNVDAFTIGVSGNNNTYDFEPEPQCTITCYVNSASGDDTFGGASAARAKKTIQAAVNQVAVGGTVIVAAGNYPEALSITKSGVTLQGAGAGTDAAQHTIIVGPVGGSSGISLPNSGTTGVTIKNLRVQGFTNGGICSTGTGNNNFTVDGVQVANTTAGNNCLGGIFVHGPVDGVTINNVLADSNTSRGIVIWDGFKQHITITNNTVTNNNCCGIELQDGTASGVTITGNTVSGNADNGIAAIGLTDGAGPNLIADNTLTNNGRFGIEVKLPDGSGAESGDGSIVVRDNVVQRTIAIEVQRPSELRDLGGIVVIRRGYVASYNNVDIPTGVVVKNNTVSGYRQTNAGSVSEGFGIVVEGRKMSVSGNTVTDNDVGIQRQAGHLPYTPDSGVDGDQANVADTYFGRGNSPVTCAVIGANTLSGNTVATRDVSPACDTAGSVFYSTQPDGAAVKVALNPQPVVTVLAEDGNPLTSYNGAVTLALGANPGGGTLSGTTTVNAVNGVATFAGLSIDKPGVGYTLVATSGNLPSATSNPFTVASGPATQLDFSTQPGGALAGAVLSPQPVVTVKDADGNTATTFNGPVSIALLANPSGGALNGTTTVNAVNGVATFTNLSIDKAGAGYTLVASAAGLSGSTSTTVTISAPKFLLYLATISK